MVKIKMNKPDILLIRALGPEGNSLPQGLLYIQSFLNKCGFKAEIWDRYVNRNITRLGKKLKEVKVVGISAMSAQSADAIYLSSMIRGWFGNKMKIIMGGPHFTVAPETARNHADHVVIGEGEVAIKNFLKSGGNTDFLIPSNPIRDLDKIPLFPTEKIRKLVRLKKYFHILTARGCPYRCNFCLGSDQRPSGLRFHSIDYVIDYMNRIIEDLGITSFNIVDDVFVLNPKRVYDFCDKVEKKIKKKISIQCFTHAGHGNYASYKRMRDVGFDLISMGVEHGNDRLLEYCGKKTTKKKIEQTCRDIYKAGIELDLTYILGNLIETNETITETVDFAIYLHEKYGAKSWFSYMQPLPGSQAFIEAEKHGHFIDPDVSNYSNLNPTYLPSTVSFEHIINERRRGMKEANFRTSYSNFSLISAAKRLYALVNRYNPKTIPNELKRIKGIVGPIYVKTK